MPDPRLLFAVLAAFVAVGCEESSSVPNEDCTADNSITGSRETCTVTLPHANDVTIATSGDERIITTNAIPDHDVGPFPNSGNPHSVSPQVAEYRVDLTPDVAAAPTPLESDGPQWRFGIALNGVVFDPVAAEPWVNPDTGERNWDWNLEALTSPLGLDCNEAHVQPSGEYHYHGDPELLAAALDADGTKMVLIGWAADGFPVYYRYGYEVADDAGSAVVELAPAYRLRTADRPGDGVAAPCGEFNGKYVRDWETAVGRGDLDECNGRRGVTPEFPGGTYYYVLTRDFPVIPRCLKGTPNASFRLGPPGPRAHRHGHRHRRGPR